MEINRYKNYDEFLAELTLRLNHYSDKRNFKFLFIVDNIKEDHNSLNILKCRFNSNFKFLFTTKQPTIIQKYESIKLETFNEEKCFELIQKHKIFNRAENEAQWIEILKLMGVQAKVEVLPLKLNKLLAMMRERPSLKGDKIKKFLEAYEMNLFDHVTSECPFAFQILTLFSYLNENNISIELIKSFFDTTPEDDLKKALEYLVRNSEIILNEQGDYNIHELTQIDVTETNKNKVDNDVFLNKIVTCLKSLENEIKLESSIIDFNKSNKKLYFHYNSRYHVGNLT